MSMALSTACTAPRCLRQRRIKDEWFTQWLITKKPTKSTEANGWSTPAGRQQHVHQTRVDGMGWSGQQNTPPPAPACLCGQHLDFCLLFINLHQYYLQYPQRGRAVNGCEEQDRGLDCVCLCVTLCPQEFFHHASKGTEHSLANSAMPWSGKHGLIARVHLH